MEVHNSFAPIARVFREQCYSYQDMEGVFLPPTLLQSFSVLADAKEWLAKGVGGVGGMRITAEVSLSSLWQFVSSCGCTLAETRLGTIALGLV